MSDTTWIVRADAKNPWIVARHILGDFGNPACSVRRGTYRMIEDDELPRFRACGKCVPAEHDGPLDRANQAAERVREAAVVVGNAALALRELDYHRLAATLRLRADEMFASAERTEVEE